MRATGLTALLVLCIALIAAGCGSKGGSSDSSVSKSATTPPTTSGKTGGN